MRFTSFFFGLGMGLAAVAGARADPPGAPPTAPAPAPDANRIICQDRIATGSRLAYARDCHTQAEWDVIRRSSQDYINTIEKRALNTNNPPGAAGH